MPAERLGDALRRRASPIPGDGAGSDDGGFIERAERGMIGNMIADAFIRLPTVRERAGLSTRSVWRYVREGRFPRPVRLGPMTTVWDARAVEVWRIARGVDPRTRRGAIAAALIAFG
jgi:prophage regulatory protein